MAFTNLYYKRTAGTPKACWVCFRPTTTVLSTINTVDFIYTCPSHLTDTGFATPIGDSGDGVAGTRKLGLSPEEIAKVKEEWEQAQKKKLEKEKEKAKNKDKDAETTGANGKDADPKPAKSPTGSLSPAASAPATPPPSHQRFTLHRDMFALRQAEHRKRRQTAQAKELAPRLPGAPRGQLPDTL
ncbi:hypothetical protein PLICRDRAFT_99224 [Plicaturopsis crispa FD-325 SS-3]|nr:hypothetical protein PLICRDRAFT_99224 [Plicaturopsis crispa FD-325 SS-3]